MLQEVIECDVKHNGGNQKGTMTLFDRLQRRENWFPELIDALTKENLKYLADLLQNGKIIVF
jgi:hypothetical protein